MKKFSLILAVVALFASSANAQTSATKSPVVAVSTDTVAPAADTVKAEKKAAKKAAKKAKKAIVAAPIAVAAPAANPAPAPVPAPAPAPAPVRK